MKQKHTILFFSKSYYPAIGGVEKHIEELAKILKKEGFLLTIITEQYEKSLPLYEKTLTAVIYRIPISRNIFLKKFYIWKWMLLNFSLVIKADIIHIHDVFYWILPYRIFIPFKKVYMTFHGYEGYPVKKRWIISRKIAEYLTNGNICVGDFMRKWYFTTPSTVIYGAVSPITKNEKPKTENAVFFGRLDDQTGILEYLEAYTIIKKIYPKFSLTIVGEGRLRNKISKGIRVEGFARDIDHIISKHRFIFVSRYLSMLEALVQGREIIAVYDNPIKRDYLLMSPFKKYVSIAGNGREIADLVIKSLKNPNLNQKRTKEGKIWAQNSTWTKIAKKYIKLWNA